MDLVENSFSRHLRNSGDPDAMGFDKLLKQVAKTLSRGRPELNGFYRKIKKYEKQQTETTTSTTKEETTRDHIKIETHKAMQFVSIAAIARDIYKQWYPIMYWYIFC